MGRTPCCDKLGLKKGPWSAQEDRILISYINRHGHSNWRALPKQAGLLRCGKSCRLRWINYLRPDIKRGNFTREEEDTIIALHQVMGNRWSAIAAKLPGRTDNEIKNVWHTNLKKRLRSNTEEKSSNGGSTSCSSSGFDKEGEQEEYSRFSPVEKFLEFDESCKWLEAEKQKSMDDNYNVNMVLNYGDCGDDSDGGVDFWLKLLSVVGYD